MEPDAASSARSLSDELFCILISLCLINELSYGTLLQELGPSECIDYRQADFRQQLEIKPVDVVVNPVGGELQGLMCLFIAPDMQHCACP